MPDISALEQSLGIPQGLYARLIARGEASGPTAVSPKGAYGQAQLMPGTAADLGVDPRDPDQNLEGGARYLKQLLDRYHGDTTKAVMAYNEGMGRVDRGIVYPEAASYVRRVTGADVVPNAGTDTPGNGVPGLGALAPLLQQILASSKPDATERGLYQQYSTQADKTATDLEASNASLKQLQQQRGALKSPDAPTSSDLTPPSEGDFRTAELAKVSNRPNDSSRILGQFLPMLAILGGAFMKNGSVASLKAAGAAMTAAKNNDQAAVQQAHQDFMDAMADMKARWDIRQQTYQDNRDKYGDDVNSFIAQQSIQEAQDKNDLGLEALRGGHLDQYHQMRQGEAMAGDKVFSLYTSELDRQARLQQTAEGLDPAKAAYWNAKNAGKSEAEALSAMRDAELAEKPGSAGTQERASKASFEKEPSVQAYQKAQPFFSAIAQAQADPNYGKTVPEQQQILDSYIRIATGGQAIRRFMAQAAQDSFGLQDKAQVALSQLAHGAMISPEAVREYVAAASKIQGEMQTLYDKKLADDANTAVRQGLDPADILPSDDLDRVVRQGLVNLSPPSTGQAALPSDLPSPKDHPDGTSVKDESGTTVAVIKNGKWTLPNG